MPTDQIVQYCLSGITVGSIYAIVAIGFNIIYNTTGIINFAQGEFVVLGAMTAISLAARMPLAIAVGLAVADHRADRRAGGAPLHPAGRSSPPSCG